jgi:hypothetical protein
LLDGKHARKILTETLCHARKIIFYRERGETISPKFNHRAGTALWEADAGRNFGVSGEQV